MFARLVGQPRSLSFYLDFALTNYREPEKQKPLVDAVADYVASKEHEFAQDQISVPQMNRIRWDLRRLCEYFAGKTVAELTVSALVAFLGVGRPGMKTYNNRRGILSTFLKFAFQRGGIAENPIPKVPHYRIRRKRGVAQTFTAVEARALMEFMETYDGGRWVPYFALCLFAGLRPGVPHDEITKLKPDAVNLGEGVIHISAEVSKVREPRKVAEGASLEERGVRATVALYCIRPDLIGEATLEEIGHVGGRSRQAVHQLADSFRATTGMAS